MSEITWGYLSMRQQETLQEIVLGNGAFVFDPAMYKLCEQLEGYGLVEILNNEDGRFEVNPTDKGREVYAQQPATATPVASATGADVSMPLDGEAFDEWVARVGKSVEDTAFYWKQIAADNLELASVNGDLLANAQYELAASRERERALMVANTELRQQVIDLDGWQTEALNRGTILEQFYANVQSLFDTWSISKGALKRGTVVFELNNLLRGFRTWQPKKVIGQAAQQASVPGEG